ncbi:hypothetical protein HWV62_22453 [Athelia sp. TMB]|nr:hypothetical protein HWV62_22453 [Athelia sp. TMB]
MSGKLPFYTQLIDTLTLYSASDSAAAKKQKANARRAAAKAKGKAMTEAAQNLPVPGMFNAAEATQRIRQMAPPSSSTHFTGHAHPSSSSPYGEQVPQDMAGQMPQSGHRGPQPWDGDGDPDLYVLDPTDRAGYDAFSKENDMNSFLAGLETTTTSQPRPPNPGESFYSQQTFHPSEPSGGGPSRPHQPQSMYDNDFSHPQQRQGPSTADSEAYFHQLQSLGAGASSSSRQPQPPSTGESFYPPTQIYPPPLYPPPATHSYLGPGDLSSFHLPARPGPQPVSQARLNERDSMASSSSQQPGGRASSYSSSHASSSRPIVSITTLSDPQISGLRQSQFQVRRAYNLESF